MKKTTTKGKGESANPIDEESANAVKAIDDTGRLVKKSKPVETEDENSDAPSHARTGTWSKKPSVRGQMEKFPNSVRMLHTQSVQLHLSVQAQLEAWNELQRRNSQEAPEITIVEVLKQFSESANGFIILVSYAELEYQELV